MFLKLIFTNQRFLIRVLSILFTYLITYLVVYVLNSFYTYVYPLAFSPPSRQGTAHALHSWPYNTLNSPHELIVI